MKLLEKQRREEIVTQITQLNGQGNKEKGEREKERDTREKAHTNCERAIEERVWEKVEK